MIYIYIYIKYEMYIDMIKIQQFENTMIDLYKGTVS